jgi:hypothetical protein
MPIYRQVPSRPQGREIVKRLRSANVGFGGCEPVARNSDRVFRQSNRLSAQYADAIAPCVLRLKLVRSGRRQCAGASDVISVFDRGSGRPVCTANGASASERSAWVICSSGLSIPTASAGRVGWMMSTMVRAAPQSGSLQSRSLMQTIVSSSALITVRACFFSSSTAFHWWFGFLGKKRTATADTPREEAKERCNVIT